MYVGSSSAADCMSMLNRRAQEKIEKFGDFAEMLNAQIAQNNVPQSENSDWITNSVSTIGRTPVPPVRRVPVDQGNYSPPARYAEFCENIVNAQQIEYDADFFDAYADSSLADHAKNAHLENLMLILPANLADAEARYAASYNHLDVYVYNLLENNDVECAVAISKTNANGIYATGTLYSAISGADEARRFFEVTKSDDWKASRALVEETALYGAILKVAENNEFFRKMYAADPQSATRNYYDEIASAMREIRMPLVCTGYKI